MYSSRLDCNGVIVLLFLNDMTSLIHDLSNPLDCDDGVERLWNRFCMVAVFFWFIARNLMVRQKHFMLSQHSRVSLFRVWVCHAAGKNCFTAFAWKCMRVISIQTICAPLETILICSFIVSFEIKVNRCSHFLHCLVWGMSSDVEAFFKHGDYWPVYDKDLFRVWVCHAAWKNIALKHSRQNVCEWFPSRPSVRH